MINTIADVILVITAIITVCGSVAIFIKKMREPKIKRTVPTTYEEKCNELNTDLIFFDH